VTTDTTTDSSPDQDDRPPELDLWLAFVAGDRVWIDDGAMPDLFQRTVASVQLIAMGSLISLLWVMVLHDAGDVSAIQRWWLAGGTLAALALSVRPVVLTLGRPATQVGYRVRIIWRSATYLALILATIATLPGWSLLAAWPLGLFVGSDIVLATWALGIDSAPRRWWFRFLVSPLHLGVLGALCAAVLSGSYPEIALELVVAYLSMHLAFLLAGMMVVSASRFDAGIQRLVARAADLAVDRERRHRAHWLHDDVLSEVRLSALRVGTGAVSGEQVARELQDLDHRLRLRQLDELFVAGPVRAADILQPHVRRVQALGITIDAVPSLERVGFTVDEATGRLLGRVLAGLTSNAINAGATHLSYDLGASGDDIFVAVTDDAGGFDFEHLPPGRGLERLVTELGRNRLARRPVPGGSTMVALVPRRSRPGPVDQLVPSRRTSTTFEET
jgi:hypothetical protein